MPLPGGLSFRLHLAGVPNKAPLPRLCQGPHAGLGHLKVVESPMGWALSAEDCGKLVSPSHHSHCHRKDLGTHPTEMGLCWPTVPWSLGCRESALVPSQMALVGSARPLLASRCRCGWSGGDVSVRRARLSGAPGRWGPHPLVPSHPSLSIQPGTRQTSMGSGPWKADNAWTEPSF